MDGEHHDDDYLQAGKKWVLEKAEHIANDLGLMNVSFTWETAARPFLLIDYSGKVERRFFEKLYLTFAGMGEPDTRRELTRELRYYLEKLRLMQIEVIEDD